MAGVPRLRVPRLRERQVAKLKVKTGELWNGGNISHEDTEIQRENRSQRMNADTAAFIH